MHSQLCRRHVAQRQPRLLVLVQQETRRLPLHLPGQQLPPRRACGHRRRRRRWRRRQSVLIGIDPASRSSKQRRQVNESTYQSQTQTHAAKLVVVVENGDEMAGETKAQSWDGWTVEAGRPAGHACATMLAQPLGQANHRPNRASFSPPQPDRVCYKSIFLFSFLKKSFYK